MRFRAQGHVFGALGLVACNVLLCCLYCHASVLRRGRESSSAYSVRSRENAPETLPTIKSDKVPDPQHQFYDQVLDPLPKPDDFNMGVTKEHYQKLQKFANDNVVALFVRISDKTSLRLIKDGNFACKSVDVHDKSSNWGPQRGTVPVDRFFNKKLGGNGDGSSMETPNPSILTSRAEDIGHAKEGDQKNKLKTGVDAKPLVLSKELLEEYKANNDLTPCDGKKNPCDNQECYHGRAPHNVDAGKETKEAANTVSFCMAPDDTGGAYTVSWHHTTYSSGDALTPLYVWSYGENGKHAPVTGDYDLWMVAPHKDTLLSKTDSAGKVRDERDNLAYLTTLKDKPIRGGMSTMTGLIEDLLNGPPTHNLNALLGRQDKPVFQHGAEAQNHYFLQPLDDIVAAIVPEDKGMKYAADGQPVKSGPCTRAQLARLLAALLKHGFFVQVNPLMRASVFHDPHFAGKSVASRMQDVLREHPECEANPNCPYVLEMKRSHYAKTLEMRQFTYRLARHVGSEWWNEAIHSVDTLEGRRDEDCVPSVIVDMLHDSGQKKDNVSPSGTEKWGAVEFVNAEGDVVGGFGHKSTASDLETKCGPNMENCFARQYCRRMFPHDLQELSGPISMRDEIAYSQFVVLNRLISARQAVHLARVMVRRELKRSGSFPDEEGGIASFSDTIMQELLKKKVQTKLVMKAAQKKGTPPSFDACLKAALRARRSGASGGDADADMSLSYGDSAVIEREASSMEEADLTCSKDMQRLALYWRALSRGNNAKEKVFLEDELQCFARIQSLSKRRKSFAPPIRRMTEAGGFGLAG